MFAACPLMRGRGRGGGERAGEERQSSGAGAGWRDGKLITSATGGDAFFDDFLLAVTAGGGTFSTSATWSSLIFWSQPWV